MQATIDKTPIAKAVENGVDAFVHKYLDSINHEFDQLFEQNSLSAEATDELRKIQCIIDQARFAESDGKELSLIAKIDKVLAKVREAVDATTIFLEKYKGKEVLVLARVISDLREILKSSKEKLDLFSKKLQFIKIALEPVSGLTNLKENSSKKEFGRWAEFYELLAESLEEIIEIFKDMPLETIEKFSNDILLLLSKKSYKNQKIDEYKRRLKFAASYVIKIIAEKHFNSDREMKRDGYTIVKDLRTLAHARYKIAISQMMSQANLENIQRLDDDDDEVSIDIDKIFHGSRNKAMS